VVTNQELDWPELLKILAAQSSSERGKGICLSLDTLSSSSAAEKSAQSVIESQAMLANGDLPEFSIIDATTPVLERLNIRAVLDVKELIVLRRFLTTAIITKTLLKSCKNPWSESVATKLADFKPQISAINHVLSPGGEINEDASPTLAALCEERRKLGREISRLLDEIVARRQMETYLQDKYVTNREGRMVIPVKSGNQHDVKGLIHDASQSKQTVFMEPEEVVPLNNRLREVQIQIQDEIARILMELSQYLARFLTHFLNADSSLLDCDVILAKGRLNQRLAGTLVTFSEENDFKLVDVRHPLLMLQGLDVVANTVTLDKNHRVLLLSGPNAGGKTILLKALGLAAQMARCGLPIPAGEGSKIPFFKILDPIVGDLQSVDQNLSSFSSHMARLSQALKYKGSTTLILIDEICGATDPEEGAALARSFIESFCKQNVYSIVTSHLGPLKENWPKDLGVEHGSLEFDSKTNRPTFQLLLGIPGRSLALSVAARLGVPQEVIDRARAYLSPTSQQRSRELEEIESFKQQILDMRDQVQKDRDDAKKAKANYQELVAKFREQRDRWLEKALDKAKSKIDNLIEDARLDRLKNKSLYDLKSELPEIVKARSGGGNKPQSLEEFKIQFKPGTPAFSTRLGRQVLIQGEPDHKGQVTVLADSMRVQLPWHGLVNQLVSDPPPQTIRRSAASQSVALSDENGPELDLRGKRIDDALPLLEKWLDDCMKNQQDNLKIIHGFGTEQLKKSIRQFLSKSRYVQKWKAGDKSSGGDGVTWVNLSE